MPPRFVALLAFTLLVFVIIVLEILLFTSNSLSEFTRLNAVHNLFGEVLSTVDYDRPFSMVDGYVSGITSHQWRDQCFRDTLTLKRYPMFPNSPTNRILLNTYNHFSSDARVRKSSGCGQRLFGCVLAIETGFYQFDIKSRFAAELWISLGDSSPENLQLVAWSYNNQTGEKQFTKYWLKTGRPNYFEILHVGCNVEHFPEVLWTSPSNSLFLEIGKHHFITFDFKNWTSKPVYDRKIKPNPAIYFDHYQVKSYLSPSDKSPGKSPYIPHEVLAHVLPVCPYTPLYISNKCARYEGVNQFFNPVYSNPYPGFNDSRISEPKNLWYLGTEKRDQIVTEYMHKLEEALPGRFKLQRIISVEVKVDNARFTWDDSSPKKGQRIFIELELHDTRTQTLGIVSEYIYKKTISGLLCYPEPMVWNRTVPVYYVVTVKNLGRWLEHFINNIERNYEETQDKNVGIVIYDYNSRNVDLEAAKRRSRLPFFKYIQRNGAYSKTKSLNEAARLIDDPNSIIFLVDLHLYIPPSLTDSIRKHCIQGRSVYTPVLVLLKCGHFPENPAGMWESYGYGLIGIYKSDWSLTGGMNENFVGWGGEDWELIDRVIKAGLEYERLRHPDLYHYFHTKESMWEK